jgi:hypothetical protein
LTIQRATIRDKARAIDFSDSVSELFTVANLGRQDSVRVILRNAKTTLSTGGKQSKRTASFLFAHQALGQSSLHIGYLQTQELNLGSAAITKKELFGKLSSQF